MLKLADQGDLTALYDFCKGDLIGTKIACYCLAYGLDKDFFSVWVNRADDEIKGVIAKFYDSITLKAVKGCDGEEIRDFCLMLCFDELMCDDVAKEAVSLGTHEMKKSYVFRGNADETCLDDIGEEYYRQLYNLICENIPGSFEASKEAYLSWLSDFTYRKRRGLSRSKGIVKDGTVYSSVMTSSETGTSAVLSGVASGKQARGKGLGRITVMSAVNELVSEGKDVYVIALNKSAEGFYEHIGFEYSGDIHIYKNKNIC